MCGVTTVDCGDYVVISNARKVKVTGKKAEQIVYRHHTIYPGGLKEIQYKHMMQRKPDEVRSSHRLAVGLLSGSLIYFVVVDHPKSSVWDVTQKQTARKKVGEVTDIRRGGYRGFPA